MPNTAARGDRATKPVRDRDASPGSQKPANDSDIQVIVRELAAVADYIAHLKKEIAALKANELCRSRIPSANDELGTVVETTASATHSIMAAAEEILAAADLSAEEYRALVETRMLAIFEACSFQDLTGQRIAKVLDALGQLEKRLGRFAKAVKVHDSADRPDAEEALRQTRREMLLMHGPPKNGEGIGQNDIDALFD